MINKHQIRVERKIKRARLKAFLLDWVIGAYTLFTVLYLISRFQGDSFPSNDQMVWAFPGGLLLALVQLPVLSLGYLIVRGTDKFLKQNVKLPKKSKAIRGAYYYAGLVLFLTCWMGWLINEISLSGLLSSDGIEGAQRIFSSLLKPELGIIGIVLRAMLETIFIALVATMNAIPIAFVLSFMCARNLMAGSTLSSGVYTALRFIFNFTRSVEPLIWAIIFSVWVGIGPFAGMMALMLHSIASLSKLYSEQIESIERGPIEAIEATGANKIQVIWFAIVPQIILPYLSFTIYRWDINIRMATIIGLVGGGGVGTLLMQYQGLARWNEVGTIIFVIALVVWFMDYLSAKIREAIY